MGKRGIMRVTDNPSSVTSGSGIKWRGIAAVIGGFLVHLTLGTIFSFGNLSTYITSYIVTKIDPTFTYETASWIYTMNMVARGLFTAVGGYLEWKIGTKFTVFLGCAMASLGVLTTAYSIEVSAWFVAMTHGLLFGAGIGVGYIGPLSCGMRWFPERKGLVTGIIVGGFGLGAFVFVPIQTAFLNPQNLAVDKETKIFKDEEILSRVPTVFIFLGGLYAILQLVGCILISNPAVNPEEQDEETKKVLRQMKIDNNLVGHPDSVASQMDKSKKNNDLAPREILKTKEFYILWITFFFNLQAIGYGTTMYKAFGQRFIHSDIFLSSLGSAASVFNTLGRVFWGALCDKTSYKISMMIASASTAILYGTLEFTQHGGQYMYAAWITGIYFCFSSTFTLLPTATSMTFGATYSSPNFGLVFTAGIFGPIVQSAMLDHLTVHIGSLGILLCTAAFSFGSFVVNIFFDQDRAKATQVRRKINRVSFENTAV